MCSPPGRSGVEICLVYVVVVDLSGQKLDQALHGLRSGLKGGYWMRREDRKEIPPLRERRFENFDLPYSATSAIRTCRKWRRPTWDHQRE